LPVMPLTSPDAVHLSADVRTLYLHQKYPARRSGAPDKIDDPIAKQVVAFPDQPSSYGPLAYAIGGAAIPFGGGDASLRGTLFGTKLVSGVFLLLTAIFAGIAAKRLGRNGALAVAMVGMNPLFLWEFPGAGHNATIMAAFGVMPL